MIDIQKVDHVGIRIRDKQRSIAFYALLGFELRSESGFEQGHPVIMQHPCGIVLNLLGPATTPDDGKNVLMDVADKAPGYTHMALRVSALEPVRTFLAKHEIAITGSIEFKGLSAIFIRDPDRNVIELDERTAATSEEPKEAAHE